MARKGKIRKDQKKLYVMLGVTIVSVLAITIAYAAGLSSTVNVSFNKVNQNALNWNVKVNNGTITPSVGGTSDTGRACGNMTVTSTATLSTLNIAATTLSKPDDSCTWTVVVRNTGDIDATLSSISVTNPSDSGVTCTSSNGNAKLVCGNITYSLATNTAGTTFLSTGGTIAKTSGTQTIYVIAKYTGSSLNTAAVTHTNVRFSLVYGQK